MVWIDIDHNNIKMKCDWCGKEAWWIKRRVVGNGLDEIPDKKAENESVGWSEITTYGPEDHDSHICPECFAYRLGTDQEPEEITPPSKICDSCLEGFDPIDGANTTEGWFCYKCITYSLTNLECECGEIMHPRYYCEGCKEWKDQEPEKEEKEGD